MHISGNEPTSVILSQTKWIQKLKMVSLFVVCHSSTEGEIYLRWMSEITLCVLILLNIFKLNNILYLCIILLFQTL